MAARRRGEDVIDLSMGNPDGPTPKHIVDKLVGKQARGPTRTATRCRKGIPRLRKAICTWYKRRYGVELDADSEAIVTIGSKEGPGAPDARLPRARRHPCWCPIRRTRSISTARSSPAPISARCA